MKLVTFRGANRSRNVGTVVSGRVVDVTDIVEALVLPPRCARTLEARGMDAPSGMLRLLHAGSQGLDAIAQALAVRPHEGQAIGDTELLAPIPRPGKIIGIGRNYADHAKESGITPFAKPRIIAKLSSSVVGSGAAVHRPVGITKLDYEAELGVVIGAFASHVEATEAFEVVAGYTVLNDLSAREFQFDVTPPQTTFAKSFDGFCPMGPWLVTKDEVADPQTLGIVCWLNDNVVQRANTAEMLFPISQLIAYISRFMTLEPGDVIATGTPAGVGAFRVPPVWLEPGDRIRIDISGVGVLEHSIG